MDTNHKLISMTGLDDWLMTTAMVCAYMKPCTYDKN